MVTSNSLEANAETATAGVFSSRTGVITHARPFVSELLPRTMVAWSAASAWIDRRLGVERKLDWFSGVGSGTSAAEAWAAAVGEAVERYGSAVSSKLLPLEWGSFREFEGDAVHGDSFALPTPDEICAPYALFDEKTPRGWVAGHDLGSGRQVLVPAQLVLFDYQERFEGELLAPWTSNGLAAHTNESDAVLAGLREIQERDAFTIRYLNSWTPPELPLEGVSDDVDRLLASVPRWHTAAVRAWDIGLDFEQPVVLVGLLSQHDHIPPFCFASACRADYPSALRKAVLEAFQLLAGMSHRGYPGAATPEPLDRVATPEDHFRLSCLPGYRDSLGWLLDEHLEGAPSLPSRTLPEATLPTAVDAVVRRGHRVISVDLTPPDLKELGWHVCKVLVPGTQPLSFGLMQCLNGRRLYDTPVELGWRKRRAQEKELNSVPHPFA